MVIYEHSLKIGFDEENARKVNSIIQNLINRYHHKSLAQETFDTGYSKYVANQFLEKQLGAFIHQVRAESFEKEIESCDDEMDARLLKRIERLSKKYNLAEKEVANDFEQLSVLEALSIGEYWDILNNKVHREIQRKEMPGAHFISIPTGGQPGYRRR